MLLHTSQEVSSIMRTTKMKPKKINTFKEIAQEASNFMLSRNKPGYVCLTISDIERYLKKMKINSRTACILEMKVIHTTDEHIQYAAGELR